MCRDRHPPRLMLVTDRGRSRRPMPELVREAVAGGVDAVQVREPNLEPAALRALARELNEVIGGRAALLINREAALAADLGAGAHLPEAGPDPATVRDLIGPAALLGRSVHSAAAATTTTGVDYLLAGHVFATVSKPGRPPLGLDGLSAIVTASPAPVLAIGGITRERVAAVIAAGAAGIAVIGAISEAADPGQAASELRTELDRALALQRQQEREQSMGQPGSRDLAQDDAALPAMTVTINGRPVEVPAGTTIAGFITGKGFTAEMVIVELNGGIVPRPDYAATEMRAGDQVEIVHAVGGG